MEQQSNKKIIRRYLKLNLRRNRIRSYKIKLSFIKGIIINKRTSTIKKE